MDIPFYRPGSLMTRLTTTFISYDTLDRHGGLFTDLLRARRKVFIERRGWPLPECRGMEFDQYDTPCSSYMVLHRNGDIVSGYRFTPSTAQSIGSTYMLRDAQAGRLPDLPEDVLDVPAPVDPGTWEITRGFIMPGYNARMRMAVRISAVKGILDFMSRNDVHTFLALMGLEWRRLAAQGGLDAIRVEAAGPVFFDGHARAQAIRFTRPEPEANATVTHLDSTQQTQPSPG